MDYRIRPGIIAALQGRIARFAFERAGLLGKPLDKACQGEQTPHVLALARQIGRDSG